MAWEEKESEKGAFSRGDGGVMNRDGELDFGEIKKICHFRQMVLKGLNMAGVKLNAEAEEILEWAVGQDWKTIDPPDWQERIIRNTGLIVTKEPVYIIIECVVELYRRKKPIIIGVN